ncbi:DUF262 domain-containing protein [Micrococcus yunnanensis]|uniref:DUF262 domain-containing protein n=1 Tax=Micrococcus yunnanensis TaxID=566027 RepID=UPI0017892FDA|nr:DUF262 domain-containing protein [Micrococcus yunnanensis]MBE1539280.1 hypothetical protein [Micrococcus yunnanensis]
MASQVEASTVSAGTLFSTSRFVVPNFQREYSWTPEEEVLDFWRDVSSGLRDFNYFLGLIITTEAERDTIIDGQQRLLTLTLLANAIRLHADESGNPLISDSMRDTFLFAPNFEKQIREPRMKLISQRDETDLDALLGFKSAADLGGDTPLLRAQQFLYESLKAQRGQLSRWADYIREGIHFARFDHPTFNAAFKVYEVVNTRGKDLTPAELLKAYIIGAVDQVHRDSVHERWTAFENAVGSSATLTNFVRHVVTLDHGYVLPRDLYETVTKKYNSSTEILKFVERLESSLPAYLRIVDPWSDASDPIHASRALVMLDVLNLRTVRPLFLALILREAGPESFQRAIRVIVPRIIGGQFGTGAVERTFATLARAIYTGQDEESAWHRLELLKPDREDFERRVRESSYNKSTLHVLRAAILQKDVLPEIEGGLHLVRPRYAEWPNFSEEEFRAVGNTIGNSILTTAERRPHGTNSIEAVCNRLIPQKAQAEKIGQDEVRHWSADTVRTLNASFSKDAGKIYYD